MNNSKNSDLIRIGVFYDGNYFYHVSNYYNYIHDRKSSISIHGLHGFIRDLVAKEEYVDKKFCQIVDAHYFRGKLNAQDAELKGLLRKERIFEDILNSEGIITHFLPLKKTNDKFKEKGIDVLLSLEAFELAFYKRFNILVLIASDGDYVPLIRKLNTLGTRVMLLFWDFEYTDENKEKRKTKTSQKLLDEVTYGIAMHEEIDKRASQDNKENIDRLFHKPKMATPETDQPKKGVILNRQSGYGFIKHPKYSNNLFFHAYGCENFNDLNVNDEVTFVLGKDEKGKDIAENVKKV